MKNNATNTNISSYIVLLIGAAIMIFPFFWMILTSFKTLSESMQIPPQFWPQGINLSSYESVVDSLPFAKLYFNTGVMIAARIVCAVVFSSAAGYAFAKIDFPGKKILFMLVVTQLMLPSQIFVIPQYQMLAKMNMLNTLFALVFPGVVSAFGTFFLRQAYMGIPDDIIEAAKLDGCNQAQIFFKIMAPLTKSSLAALAVFTAVFAYGDLMWPLVVNTDLNLMTLSSGLATLKGQFNTNFPVLMAGSFLAMLPMVLLYVVFQKQFIEGIALTGTKG
ncbi:MAG: carbohydrate ABC transporter permease [Cellulosilyticaceae bacterium]